MEVESGAEGEEKTTEENKIPIANAERTSGNNQSSVSRKGKYITTAYCHCAKCCGKSNGITASGVKAVEGVTIAADTKVLPFGTKVYIEGIGERIVQDRGGAIKGNRIDIYFNTHEKALQYGRQTKEVTILN